MTGVKLGMSEVRFGYEWSRSSFRSGQMFRTES